MDRVQNHEGIKKWRVAHGAIKKNFVKVYHHYSDKKQDESPRSTNIADGQKKGQANQPGGKELQI